MRKHTGAALLMAGLIVGLVLTSTLLTRTPAASETPERIPVPTFTPTPAASVADYTAHAGRVQSDLAASLGAVGRLIGAPRLADPVWGGEVQQAMAQVEAAYTGVARLEAPAELAAYHAQLLAGASDCSAAMRVLDLALDEQDRAAVAVVAALLQRCQSGLVEAYALLSGAPQADPVP